MVELEVSEFIRQSIQNGTLEHDLKNVQEMLKAIERPEYREYYEYSKEELQNIKAYVTGIFRGLLIEKANKN